MAGGTARRPRAARRFFHGDARRDEGSVPGRVCAHKESLDGRGELSSSFGYGYRLVWAAVAGRFEGPADTIRIVRTRLYRRAWRTRQTPRGRRLGPCF